MVLVPFERHRPESIGLERDLETLQDHIESFLNKLSNQPGLDTILIEGEALTAATTKAINHSLGRTLRGWRVVDTTAAATFHRDTAATYDTAKVLALQASANCTISIEVF